MGVMLVVILIAFLTVVAVMYWGSKEDVHEGAHLSAENSRATTIWMQRAQVAEAARMSAKADASAEDGEES
jgi:uncharacterized iron-regulated membrane protein